MCKFCENNEWIYFKSGLSMGLNGNKIDFDYNTCACGSFEDEITIFINSLNKMQNKWRKKYE